MNETIGNPTAKASAVTHKPYRRMADLAFRNPNARNNNDATRAICQMECTSVHPRSVTILDSTIDNLFILPLLSLSLIDHLPDLIKFLATCGFRLKHMLHKT